MHLKKKLQKQQDAVDGRGGLRPGRGFLRQQHRLRHRAALQVRGRDRVRRRLEEDTKVKSFNIFSCSREGDREAEEPFFLLGTR